MQKTSRFLLIKESDMLVAHQRIMQGSDGLPSRIPMEGWGKSRNFPPDMQVHVTPITF